MVVRMLGIRNHKLGDLICSNEERGQQSRPGPNMCHILLSQCAIPSPSGMKISWYSRSTRYSLERGFEDAMGKMNDKNARATTILTDLFQIMGGINVSAADVAHVVNLNVMLSKVIGIIERAVACGAVTVLQFPVIVTYVLRIEVPITIRADPVAR